MLDRHLRRLALACGLAAAACIVLLGLLVLVSIASRLAGVYIGGLTEGAGYCMAAAGSLGLAYTFLEGEHIRVDIVLNRLPARARLRFEQLAVVITAALSCFLAWYVVRMALLSYDYGDISDGSDALPLWLPQLPVAAGFTIFALIVTASAVDSLRNRRPPLTDRRGGLLDRGS